MAATGFGAAADAYERARPDYPAAAVAWLGERLAIVPGRTVLDLAAGTGKLTRALAPLGARIVAVEPVAAMRAKLAEVLPEVEALEGTAEAIPLGDGSVDAVVVAQAFHWFDAEAALDEIHRVLRPGGGLGLVWNVRDLSSPLNARVEELLLPYRGETETQWNLDVEGELARSGAFGEVTTEAWPHEQHLDPDRFVDRVGSTSFVAALPDPDRERLLDEVRAIGRQAGDPVVVRYVTQAYVAERT